MEKVTHDQVLGCGEKGAKISTTLSPKKSPTTWTVYDHLLEGKRERERKSESERERVRVREIGRE